MVNAGVASLTDMAKSLLAWVFANQIEGICVLQTELRILQEENIHEPR